jgi:NTP pyrophosphatase (non-canonical NTP hydrolase)
LKNTKEYIENVLKTENIKSVSLSTDQSRLLHAAMGVSTEAAEFLDNMKKHIFYGKNLDMVNIQEELGDLLWYVGIAIDTIGSDFLKIMQQNIDKLAKRYEDQEFTEDQAIDRDIPKELNHFDDERSVFKAKKCPKCNVDPQVLVSISTFSGKQKATVYCPDCQLTGPDGNDYLKGVAIDKGIKEWELMLKEKKSQE